MNQQQMLEQMKPQALDRIQARLVLEAIVAAEAIEVSEEDVEKELANMAVEAPSLTNWYASVAKSQAESLGFEVEIVGNGSIVRSQSPAPNTLMESHNAKIILYTESDMEKTTVTVPDLSGKTAVAANEILANHGLNIRIAGTNNYMSGSGAVAIAQSHAPGSEVERGTVITVTFRNQDADDIAQE